MADNQEFMYDALLTGPERDKFFSFSGDIAKVRSRVLGDAHRKVFLVQDDDHESKMTRRSYEKAAVYYISSGDIVKISEMLGVAGARGFQSDSEEVEVGDLSENALVQAQCLFISAVTLCTRAAVDGGLYEVVAYNLSDAYINNMLNLTSAKQVEELAKCMVYDFTYEVYRYKYRNCTQLVCRCCEYISRHLHDAITLKTLSELTGKSENYISDQFFKDMNMRPTLYIRKLKLNYARHVFEATDLSVTAVSDMLAFPSTSSFITYFKQEFGITPLQFKKSTEDKNI